VSRERTTDIYRSAAGAALVRKRYDELLDLWPVPAERLQIPTRQGETFVVATGPVDGPPVLALQGSGANTAMWLPQIATLAAHSRVYAVDVIGEPGRSATTRPALDSAAYACWLDDVLDGLGLAQVAVLGRSLGGWFALDYALRRPDRVTALVLLSPSGVGRRRIAPLIKVAVLGRFGERGLQAALKAAVGPLPPAPAEPQAWSAALAGLSMLTAQQFRHRFDAIPRFGDEALRGLTMPVLAIVGGRDPMVDSAGTRDRLTTLVPSVDVRFLPGAGHLLPNPSETVASFLTHVATAQHHG
jgi:pimeloyl-ACP methyl ester carboxylesterase